MKHVVFFLFLCAYLISCKRNKNEELVVYNDRIVNIMEDADRIMKSWNSSNILNNYPLNKEATKLQIEVLQDSLKKIQPPTSDDTLRLSGISILNSYMQSFTIYDTIYRILNDSLYLAADSVRVSNLLMTNKNMVEQQSTSFAEIQKRFAKRYELEFMQ